MNDQHVHYVKPETLMAVEMLANKKSSEEALEDVKENEEKDQKQHEYISYGRVGFDDLYNANPNWRSIKGVKDDIGSVFEYLPKFKQLHTLILIIRMKQTELHKLMPITKVEGLTKLLLAEHQDEPMSFPKKFLRGLSKMPNLQHLELPMYYHSAIELLRSESIHTLVLFNPFDVAQDRIDKLFSAFMRNTSLERFFVIGAEDETNKRSLEQVYNHFSRLGIYRDMLPRVKIMIEHLKENKEKRLQMQKIMPILMGTQLGARNLNQIIDFLPTIYNFTGDMPTETIEQKALTTEARALEQLIDPRRTVNPDDMLTRTKRKLVELEKRPLPLVFDTTKRIGGEEMEEEYIESEPSIHQMQE